METLLTFDYQLFDLINGQFYHAFLDAIMPFWRSKYFWAPLYLFGIMFIGLNYRKQAPYILVFLLLAIILSDQVSSGLIKPLVNRLRPCNQPGILEYVRLLIPCGSGKSFVSSHATNHFAVATYIALLFRGQYTWLHPLALFWAASISYGQIYVGVHYPLDIIGGAILGIFIGQIMAYIVRRLMPSFNTEQTPSLA